MRTVFFYATEFSWKPAQKAFESADPATEGSVANAVVAFIHSEPGDEDPDRDVINRFLKRIKGLARKWETRQFMLYSFSHLGDEKADLDIARLLIKRISERLEAANYSVDATPFGYFCDFKMASPGAPLSRIFKQF